MIAIDEKQVENTIDGWIKRINHNSMLPSDIVAICFMLTETYIDTYLLELTGSKTYNPDDNAWMWETDYRPEEYECPDFCISPEVDWKTVQDTMVKLLNRYVKDNSDLRLLQVQHIAVGFGDGEPTTIK